MSGKRRSASAPGGGESGGGSSRDRRLSGQWRKNVSMVGKKREKNVFEGKKWEERAWGEGDPATETF